jgi:hypothetical protein
MLVASLEATCGSVIEKDERIVPARLFYNLILHARRPVA